MMVLDITRLLRRNACALAMLLGALLPCALRAQADKAFALPKQAPSSPNNPTSPEKVKLGEKLFFDPILSGDDSLSCASCHDPDRAFADGKRVSTGAGGAQLTRNTPTLLNVGFFESFFWDGRSASLEDQALAPIEAENEMDQDLEQLVDELAEAPEYVALFKRAFGGGPSAGRVAMALAAYERTLVAVDSPFDRYLAGEDDAISDFAKEGWEIFQRNGCDRCHSGPLFSDGRYYRLSAAGSDVGREAVTGNPEDRFRFRTPTLRNVAETAPYFHDGSAETLFDVVSFYYRRTSLGGVSGLKPDFAPLAAQSYSEIDAIVEFLETLTSESSD